MNDETFDEEKPEKTYIEKLKDPRWQKLRLKIFDRDKWKCLNCSGNDETLHVHHKRYFKDKEPWECPEEFLATLCEGCHEAERTVRKENEKFLLKVLRWHFLSDQILDLAELFKELKPVKKSSQLSFYIDEVLLNSGLQDRIDEALKGMVERGVADAEYLGLEM